MGGMKWLGISIAFALYGNTPGVQGATFFNAVHNPQPPPPELATVGFDPLVLTPFYGNAVISGWPWPPGDAPEIRWDYHEWFVLGFLGIFERGLHSRYGL